MSGSGLTEVQFILFKCMVIKMVAKYCGGVKLTLTMMCHNYLLQSLCHLLSVCQLWIWHLEIFRLVCKSIKSGLQNCSLSPALYVGIILPNWLVNIDHTCQKVWSQSMICLLDSLLTCQCEKKLCDFITHDFWMWQEISWRLSLIKQHTVSILSQINFHPHIHIIVIADSIAATLSHNVHRCH